MSLESHLATGRAGLREVSDVRTLRALAHPVRVALMEALVLYGPLTATQAGEKIGETPTTCSFHLRQLARYGFVEEAGGGKGRARPWRLTAIGMHISGVHEDLEAEQAAAALVRLLRARHLDRYQTWLESRSGYPREWRQAAEESQLLLWLTTSELQELKRELSALLLPRFRERLTDPRARPADALPIELLLFAYPIAPPLRER